MNSTSTDAPLTQWKIVGFEERWHRPVPEVKQPGGTCWHCGTGIAYCYIIENLQTKKREIIGSTCAERVGMNKEQLNRYYAAYYRDRANKKRAATEAELVAEHGEHGTQTRFESGCICRDCRGVAPHGTPARWRTGCLCLDCIEGRVTIEPDTYWIDDAAYVMVDIATGKIANAEIVDGNWGSQWRVRTPDGHYVYLALSPKQRTTHTKKGYVEAIAPMLIRGDRSRRIGKREDPSPILALGSPLFDVWGEPLPHPA